jgi:pyrroline-5-carboxylate reductase
MRIAFIGGGNMATALIGGLLRDGMAPTSIHVVEVDPQRLAALRQKFGIDGSSAPDDGLRGTDATVFAVKPQQMREACTQCRPWLDGGFALTIAAGIPAASVAAWSGRPQVVRAMPNTPALIGAGITGMSAGAVLAPAARALAERIMSAAGEVVWFDDEAMLDAVTAVSGSGPAYVFFFIEALQAAGQAMGMTADQARRLSIATFRGAAQLAYQSDQPVQALREQVTSKGGTTAAALEKMQTLGLHQQIVAAVLAARDRSRELASTYGDTPQGPGTG